MYFTANDTTAIEDEKTEVSAKVMTNNDEVVLDDQDNFAIDLKSKVLTDENVLVAKDTLGNESVYVFSVQEQIKEQESTNIYTEYLGLIIGAIFGISYSVYLFVSSRKRQ